jgi:hypothetical protein
VDSQHIRGLREKPFMVLSLPATEEALAMPRPRCSRTATWTRKHQWRAAGPLVWPIQLTLASHVLFTYSSCMSLGVKRCTRSGSLSVRRMWPTTPCAPRSCGVHGVHGVLGRVGWNCNNPAFEPRMTPCNPMALDSNLHGIAARSYE